MFAAGFTTLRLGLETTRFDHREEIDLKVSEQEFVDAINCLKKAGFEKINNLEGGIAAWKEANLPLVKKK